MSLIPTSSWQSPGTPDYITRTEVIDFVSSVASYISTGGFSSFVFNATPNPNFSTVNINPTGNINMNGAPLLLAQKLGLSSLGSVSVSPWTGNQNAITSLSTDNQSTEPIQGQLIALKPVVGVVNVPGIYANNSGLYGAQNDNWNGYGIPSLQWLGSNGGNQWILTNISSINGVPPTGGATTFTTLTGNTLNAQTVNTSVLGNVSTINGLPKIAYLDTTYTTPGITSIQDNLATVVATIATPYTVPANAAVLATATIRVGGFAPGSPAVAYLNFGLRVGGQGAGGGVFYTQNCAIPTALTAGFINLTISGVYLTPTASATNTIEIVAYNMTGQAITCQITNPTSPANLLFAQVLS